MDYFQEVPSLVNKFKPEDGEFLAYNRNPIPPNSWGYFRTQEVVDRFGQDYGRLVWNSTSKTCHKKVGKNHMGGAILCGIVISLEKKKIDGDQKLGYYALCKVHDPGRRSDFHMID